MVVAKEKLNYGHATFSDKGSQFCATERPDSQNQIFAFYNKNKDFEIWTRRNVTLL